MPISSEVVELQKGLAVINERLDARDQYLEMLVASVEKLNTTVDKLNGIVDKQSLTLAKQEVRSSYFDKFLIAAISVIVLVAGVLIANKMGL